MKMMCIPWLEELENRDNILEKMIIMSYSSKEMQTAGETNLRRRSWARVTARAYTHVLIWTHNLICKNSQKRKKNCERHRKLNRLIGNYLRFIK